MKYVILSIFLLTVTGCATLNNTATINKTPSGVEFNTSQPCEMTMKEDNVEYTYNGKAESLISKIISVLTLGVISTR